jgi:o-succinylbenzoate synthase
MIRAVRLLDHHWALPAPAASARATWTERRALLLVLEDAAGHLGLGEAAPLPGFSQDSWDDGHAALRTLLGRELPTRDENRPCGVDLRHASAAMAPPAARAALEAALLDLWSRQANVPAWVLLAGSATPSNLPIAAWLPDGMEAALEAARTAHAHGIRAFKVKLDGRRGLESGIATLRALRSAFGAEITLRGDANQSATLALLEPHLGALRELRLEWLEEPTAERLTKSLGVPLALDESLAATTGFPQLDQQPDVAALVLKPTALGGLGRALGLAEHARAHHRKCVASHTLEGPIGYMTAATLALALPEGPAHGLGAYGRFVDGTPPPALPVGREHLVRWEASGFGLSLEQALAGTEVDGTEQA